MRRALDDFFQQHEQAATIMLLSEPIPMLDVKLMPYMQRNQQWGNHCLPIIPQCNVLHVMQAKYSGTISLEYCVESREKE